MKKRIPVLALSLVLCLGMMPGMMLVASADSAITLPYSCDFSSEDSMSGWTTVQCVSGTGINNGQFRFHWTYYDDTQFLNKGGSIPDRY